MASLAKVHEAHICIIWGLVVISNKSASCGATPRTMLESSTLGRRCGAHDEVEDRVVSVVRALVLVRKQTVQSEYTAVQSGRGLLKILCARTRLTHVVYLVREPGGYH